MDLADVELGRDLRLREPIEETQVLTSGILAEYGRFTGGVINAITKSGGNKFTGSFFVSGTGDSFQGDNLSTELQSKGLTATNSIKKLWDINPSVGGPIVRDKLWFFGTYRYQVSRQNVASMWVNKNAGDATKWNYDPDKSQQAVDDGAVVPLLYEGRMAELGVDRERIDQWFERVTARLSDEQQLDLKRKFSRAEAVSRTGRPPASCHTSRCSTGTASELVMGTWSRGPPLSAAGVRSVWSRRVILRGWAPCRRRRTFTSAT